jgi:branched-chain amino acid aminotransferase
VAATIGANGLQQARIRITVSAGEGGLTPDPAGCGRPITLVAAEQYHPYVLELYERGFRAITSATWRRDSRSPLSRLKTISRLADMLAGREARQAGVDEVICLNERGLLAEASRSNIFVVEDGVLKTPPVHSGVLPGITRRLALELAAELGIKSAEVELEAGVLHRADEAFLTNSLMEIMPLTGVDGLMVGQGMPGTLTRRLMAAYRQLVITECGL